MKRILLRIGMGLFAVGACVAGAAWCFVGGREKESLPPPAPIEERKPTVAVTPTASPVVPAERFVEAVGALHGYDEVTVSAGVEGQVVKVRHEVGDRVSADEVLLEIDPTTYDLGVRQAQAALDAELARLGLIEAPAADFDVQTVPSVVEAALRRDTARAHYQRALATPSATAAQELDDCAEQLKVAEAEYTNQVFAARSELAAVRMKQEALALARRQLHDAAVRAPAPSESPSWDDCGPTYRVAQRSASVGAYVRPGQEVYRLVIDDSLKLRVAVPEREAAGLRVGLRAEVETAVSADPFDATVTRISPVVDPATRTVEVEIDLANPQGTLKPGGFAKVRIAEPVDSPVALAGGGR